MQQGNAWGLGQCHMVLLLLLNVLLLLLLNVLLLLLQQQLLLVSRRCLLPQQLPCELIEGDTPHPALPLRHKQVIGHPP